MLVVFKSKKFTSFFCLLFISAICFAQAITENKNQNIIAGIEVGSKGVKLSVLEKSATEIGAFKVLKDSSINTDFISFTMQSHDATLDALTDLYTYVKTQWKIPSANIATVISSGVKAQADKANKTKFIDALIESFKIQIDEPNKTVEVVSVLKESILSHYGIIANENRYNTFLIDIGSGNTKGGYFDVTTKKFVMFQLPSGTKSTTNSTEKICGTPCDFSAFKNNINTVVDSLEKNEIIYAVNASGAFPATTNMAVSGGIAWAVATLLNPEKNTTTIDVTYKDLVRFRENLMKYYKEIPDTNNLKIKGISIIELSKIRKEVQKVLNVFDIKSLLGGSTLLLRIMRQFEGVNSSKKFTLIKNGQVGWITGYINGQGVGL